MLQLLLTDPRRMGFYSWYRYHGHNVFVLCVHVYPQQC